MDRALRVLCLGVLLTLPQLGLGRFQTFGRVAVFEKMLDEDEAPVTESPEAASWPRPWPAEALIGHEKDVQRVNQLYQVMKELEVNNTVIIVPANLGFLNLVLNLRCRLLALGSSNLLVWALDADTAAQLKERRISHFYDSALYSVATAVGYGTSQEEYSKMMSERPKVWWRLLATGFDLLFLDADVVALDYPERAVEKSADFEGQLDYQSRYGWGFERMTNESTLCAGVFWIRSSAKALRWMDRVVKSFDSPEESRLRMLQRYGHWDDQIALNYVIHTPDASVILNPSFKEARRQDIPDNVMSVLYSHPTRLLGGTLLERSTVVGKGYGAKFTYELNGQQGSFSPAVIHLNGRGRAEKLKTMKENGWWELDETNTCLNNRKEA